MTDEGDGGGLSGRFVKVPVEFVDRTLHPWMGSAAWREAYVRLHRNRTYKRHQRDMGQTKLWLEEGQLPISVRWLVDTCPELTEKSARIFLDYLEAPPDGSPPLIRYPGGKKRGARFQVCELLESWAPTESRVREEKRARRASSPRRKGRTRRGQEALEENGSGDTPPAEGRSPSAIRGDLPPGGANSTGSGANSGTATEGSFPAGANSGNGERPATVRGFGLHRPFEGRTLAGGGVGGEGEGDPASPGDPPSVSPPLADERERRLDRPTSNSLLDFAAAYCAPEGRAALPLAGRELTALRALVHDVYRTEGTVEGVKDFFIRARRWADSDDVKADRMNATFIRSNQVAIRRSTALTRQEEQNNRVRDEQAEARRAEYDFSDRYADWQARLRDRFRDELGEDERKDLLEAAEAEVEPPPIRNDLSMGIHAIAVRQKALELYGVRVGQPPPQKESTA